jgi:hypothetical protein
MAVRSITSTRWVMGILVAALLASVLVVVGLIQITGSSPSSSASSSESPAVDSASATPSPSAGQASTTSATPSTSGGRSATTPTTTPVELAGSGLLLPAAWTGSADMTITVHGRCAATGGTSFYTRPAQFALQVPPTPTASAGSGSASASPTTGPAGSASPATSESTTITPPAGPVTMTLGITPTDVPGLSIYSTTSGRDGTIRWTWSVDAQADPATPGRTLLSATLVDDQPSGGALPPNLLMDSETDLMPCEAGSGVRLPRPLAKGATVTGWISATEASLVVDATTTDGERSVHAGMDLTRVPGS